MKNKIIFKTLMLKGEAGSTIVSMEKTGHVGTADIYTITFNDGSTTEISLENMSAITSVEKTSSTDTEDIYTITCADGSTQTFSVSNHNADIAALSASVSADLGDMADDIDTIDARVDNFINSVVPNTVETLWTGSINKKNDSATLSKAVSNFDYIDLYLLGSADSKYIRVPASQTSLQIQQQNMSDDASSNFLRLWEMGVSISGTTVSITKVIAWEWDDPDNSNPTVTANAQNSIPITRIDGVKIASNAPAELVDIRVGANGITYESAGAATRGQYSELKSGLVQVVVESKNLLPKVSNNIIVNDVQCTYSDGVVTVIGTSNAAGGRLNAIVPSFTLPAGNYIAYSNPGSDIVLQKVADNSIIGGLPSAVSFTLSEETALYCGFNFSNGAVYNNSYEIQIEKGNTASAWEAPSKVVPIDHSVVVELDETINDGKFAKKTIVFNAGGYVNNVAHNITSLNGYSYSDLIVLKKDQTIKITGAYSNTATVVDLLSKWTAEGTYSASLQAYTSTGFAPDVEYTATEDIEYLRVCSMTSYIPNVYIQQPNFDDIVNDVAILKESVSELLSVDNPYWTDITMFPNIAICGDSYSVGQIYINANDSVTNWESSWGKVLGRKTGCTVHIYGSGGADTNTWQTRDHCLPQVLSDSAKDLYIINLGINDSQLVTLGTLADITGYVSYENYPNTFYGNYGKIIEQIMAHAPNAKIVIAKVLCPANTGIYNYSSSAIEEIADHYGIPFIETNDNVFLMSAFYNNNMVGGHPTAPLYSGIANVMIGKMSKCLTENISYFNTWHL